MPLPVRKARQDDLPDVAALMEQTWSQSNAEVLPDFTVKQLLGENSITALIETRLPDLWVAEETGTGLLGVLGVTPDGYIWACYVRSDRQRQGIGGALLSAVETHFRGLGLPTLTLDIIDGNTAAQRFYGSRGWIETGRRTEQLPGHTATSIQLALHL